MALKTISHGEANWEQKITENFKDLYQGGAISDSGWVDCATLMNGATTYKEDKYAVKRRVLNFGKFKLVKIMGQITLDLGNLDKQAAVIKLPSGLRNSINTTISSLMAGAYGTAVRWELSPDGQDINLVRITSRENLPANSTPWFMIDFSYISK